VDEKVNWFDGIKTETWSTLWFEDFVEQLGYEMSPRFKFYCLLPQKTIADGLWLIVLGTNTRVPEEEELIIINVDSSEWSRARLHLLLGFTSSGH